MKDELDDNTMKGSLGRTRPEAPSRLYKFYVLLVIMVVNIVSRWHRNALPYLSSVMVPQCRSTCSGATLLSTCQDCSTVHATSSVEIAACEACQECRLDEDSAYYNLKDGTCLTLTEFGMLAGAGFAVVFATLGLAAGSVTDRAFATERGVALHATALFVWSLATYAEGLCTSFWGLLVCRIMLSAGQAFHAPAAYALLALFFEPHERSSANAVFGVGTYLGEALSSLSIIMADKLGWRNTQFLSGSIGIGVGLLQLNTVHQELGLAREHEKGGLVDELGGESQQAFGTRQRKTVSLYHALRMLASSKTVLLLLLASSIRFMGSSCITVYLPTYMSRAFPSLDDTYSVTNAAVVAVGGCTAILLGGLLTDRLATSRGSMSVLALVPACGTMLSILPFAGVVLIKSFPLAMLCLALEYLLGEVWLAPIITVLQELAPAPIHGLAVSVFLFCCTVVGTLAPSFVGMVDPGTTGLGMILLAVVATTHGVSGLLFGYLGEKIRLRESRGQAFSDEEVAGDANDDTDAGEFASLVVRPRAESGEATM